MPGVRPALYAGNTAAMNCVSYEIALRLKKAGFPADETEREKWLYNSNGVAVWTFTATPRAMIYAPTLADILPLLPEFNLKAADSEFGFFCYRLDPAKARWATNPHDACALAWLALNEKK